eukprot:TRINITY_DN32742_c0_g1_i1.p1 TRINITY_DN32742_c0_g1~~TRINITY_DN32742_c0_g1_i1.p1  ORF type:complete len:498 (+),score=72.24 TRINITY_DN32742_c0_g1_i1:144-1637(+)
MGCRCCKQRRGEDARDLPAKEPKAPRRDKEEERQEEEPHSEEVRDAENCNDAKQVDPEKEQDADLRQRRKEEIDFISSHDSEDADVYYLVDIRWLEQWRLFAFKDGPLPGAVDNSRLLRADGQPIANLRLVDDYRGVNEALWRYWQERYSGGPEIRRSELDIYAVTPAEDRTQDQSALKAPPAASPGEVVLALKEPTDAAEAESPPSPDSPTMDAAECMRMGMAFEAQGNLEKATLCYRMAIQADKNNSAAHIQLAYVLHLSGDVAGCMQAYRDALAVNNTTPSTILLGSAGNDKDTKLSEASPSGVPAPKAPPHGLRGLLNGEVLSSNCTLDLSSYPEHEVFLNVYDLGGDDRVQALNRTMVGAVNVGGLFHAAVEVFGVEYCYGMSVSGKDAGVVSLPPRADPYHTYHATVPLGPTSLRPHEVRALIERMEGEWPLSAYDLLEHNCLTFCNAFADELGVKQIPGWVDRAPRMASSIMNTVNMALSCTSRSKEIHG